MSFHFSNIFERFACLPSGDIPKEYKTLTGFVLDALFPPQCIPCGKKLSRAARFSTICEECFARIPLRSGFSCAQCARRLPALLNTCHAGTPAIAAATDFKNKEAQALIHALKYNHIRDAALPLAEILNRYIAQYLPPSAHPELHIVPIPLHIKRMRMRGFNQSELLAIELTKLDARVSVHITLLTRTRHTASQTAAPDHDKRRENVKDAFTAHTDSAVHAPLFILDDVCTSGGTITEAMRALRATGMRKSVGLVVARA